MASTPSNMDAGSRVASTTELLILILTHLDPVTLLTSAQRVNRAFHACVSSTLSIQRQLFFLPNQTPDAVASSLQWLHNPFPKAAASGAGTTSESSPQATTPGRRRVRRVQLNPLLARIFPIFFPHPSRDFTSAARTEFQDLDRVWWPCSFREDCDGESHAAEVPHHHYRNRRDPVLRDGASWRRMLLSDPAPTRATLVWSTSYMHGGKTRRVDLMDATAAAAAKRGGDKGKGKECDTPRQQQEVVRMGPLYDLVQELAVERGRFNSGSFETNWTRATAYTEDEYQQGLRDWTGGGLKNGPNRIEGYAVTLEADPPEGKCEEPGDEDEFELVVAVKHSFSCIASIGAMLPGFRSQARDVVEFEELEQAEADADAAVGRAAARAARAARAMRADGSESGPVLIYGGGYIGVADVGEELS